MPFPHSFLLDIISTTRQKVAMDAKRRVLPPSIDFPSTTLMTNYSVEESTIRYSKFGMKPIFIESRILVACSKSRILVLEYEFSIRNSFSILDPTIKISVPLGSSLFSVQATQVSWIVVPTTESLFLVSTSKSLFLVPSTQNENFVLVPCAFPRLQCWPLFRYWLYPSPFWLLIPIL